MVPFWHHFGCPGGLGGSCSSEHESWGVLGPSWGRLGAVLKRLEDVLGTSWGAFPCQFNLKSIFDRCSDPLFFDFGFILDARTAQDAPKPAPRRPQDGPKRLPKNRFPWFLVGLGRQEAPRGLQDGPGGLQEAAKTAQDGPRVPKFLNSWISGFLTS